MSDGILGDRAPKGYTWQSMSPTEGDPFAPGAIWRYPMPLLPDRKSVASDWAMVVENSYNITGRGRVLSGTLLYGWPMKGDEVRSIKWKCVCLGVERYCISGWWGAGGRPGILVSDNQYDIGIGAVVLGFRTDDSNDSEHGHWKEAEKWCREYAIEAEKS